MTNTATGRSATPGIVQFPSDTVPSVPPFTFAVPPGWVASQSPDALVVVGSPATEGDAWASAALQHERLAPPMDLKAAAIATWTKVKVLAPGAELQEERVVKSGDVSFYLRGVDYPAVGTMEPVSNLHILFFGPPTSAGLLNFFQFTCMMPTKHTENIVPALVAMTSTFRFT
jgi:hypothetical protein